MFLCSRKQVLKISNNKLKFGLVNTINTNLLMLKMCSVWEGILSMIYFCITI